MLDPRFVAANPAGVVEAGAGAARAASGEMRLREGAAAFGEVLLLDSPPADTFLPVVAAV